MVIKYQSDTSAMPGQAARPSHPVAPLPSVPDIGGRAASLALLLGRRLRRKALAMLMVAALPLAGAFAFVRMMADQFQSTASVFIDPNAGRPGRGDAQMDPAVMAMHIRLATSRSILEKAIAKEKLAEDSTVFVKPTGTGALLNIALSVIGKAPAGPVEDRKMAILRLMTEQVAARPAGEANLLEITASVPDAGTAARLANAVAQALVDDLVATADAAQGNEQARLVGRGETLKTRLREVESRLAQFRAQNGLDKGQGGEQDLAAQLSRARTATADARSRSDQIQKLLATGKNTEAIADLVRSPAIDRLRIQYNEAAAQEASFRSSLGPRHPSYLEAAEQARERRRLLMEGLRLAASSARADLQTAIDTEQALEKRIGPDAKTIAAQANPPPAQLRELEREAEIARVAYERHLRAMESGASEGQSGIARIVVRATPPAHPLSGPAANIWKAAGAVAGVLALLVFLLGRWSDKPARPAPRNKPPLDFRPAAPPVASNDTVRRPPRAQPAPLPPSPDDSARDAADAADAEPQLDRIAAEISSKDAEFTLQSILVTGTTAAADRADTAIDLARTLTRHDVRVLVIEGNEAEPCFSQRIAAFPASGTLCLNGRDRLVMQVEGTEKGCFWAVPGLSERPVPANDGHLRRYPAMAGHFDLVIVVGPDLDQALAVRKLARLAQTVVVVTDAGVDLGGKLPGRLGLSADAIRVIPVRHGATNAAVAPVSRPMSVIRMQKCA